MLVEYPDTWGIWKIRMHKSCQHNEVRAARGRVLGWTPSMAADVEGLLESQIPVIQACMDPVTPIPDHQTLVNNYLPQKKAKLYNKALQSLQAEPLKERDWRIKAFVKAEKLKIEEKDGDPRMIQARSPRFNIELGLFTRAVEKNLYSLVDPQLAKMGIRQKVIAKGMNQWERAKVMREMWDSFKTPRSISFDLSRWDQHVGTPLLRVMHKWYNNLVTNKWFQYLLSKQLVNKAMTEKGLVKYSVQGGVMSGDMTTALGNCVAVVVILLTFRALLKELAGEIAYGNTSEMSRKAPRLCVVMKHLLSNALSTNPELMKELANNPIWFKVLDDGDDHVIMTEQKFVPVITAMSSFYWRMAGHELKIEGVVKEFHLIEFCQTKPHKVGNKWVMMPDPRKVLATSGMVSRGNLPFLRPYLKTVWLARAYLHQGQPVLGNFFHLAAKGLNGPLLSRAQFEKNVSGLDYNLKHAMRRKEEIAEDVEVELKMPPLHVITPEQRLMCWEQWGLTPNQQVEMEKTRLKPPGNTQILQRSLLVKTGKGLKEYLTSANIQTLLKEQEIFLLSASPLSIVLAQTLRVAKDLLSRCAIGTNPIEDIFSLVKPTSRS